MKKLILKTVLITLSAAIVLLVALFGIMSLWAPIVMMDFTASLGLTSLSGDYAYREYERSGNIYYLAQSFLCAADTNHYKTAVKRFDLFYEHENFDAFCESRSNIILDDSNGFPDSLQNTFDYRSYVCGLAVCVKYNLSDFDSVELCEFAIQETETFFSGCPVIMLGLEAALADDGEFCELLLEQINSTEKEFVQNDYYKSIVKILEGVANE